MDVNANFVLYNRGFESAIKLSPELSNSILIVAFSEVHTL